MSEDAGQLIVVFNSGSSSLKVGVFARADGDERAVIEGGADGLGRGDGSLTLKAADGTVLVSREHTAETAEQAMEAIVGALGEHMAGAPAAVGHRVVHGGPKLREHTRITPEVLREMEATVHFAPLHIPQALTVIRKAEALYPATPQFACFDTTFHRTMPPRATHLPIPERYFAEGVQRYGFHGLSCESVMHRLGAGAPGRMVIAHLGGGSSVTAVRDGRSIDTSMGLSPTGGVPMATRSGDLDPGVMLYLLRSGGDGGGAMTAEALEAMVNHACGMTGLSGGESDMRALEEGAGAGNGAAALAVEVFATEVRKCIGGYAALMGGVDLVVFTGGIGQHDAAMRARICDGLEWKVEVIEAEEEAVIARHCRAMLGGAGQDG